MLSRKSYSKIVIYIISCFCYITTQAQTTTTCVATILPATKAVYCKGGNVILAANTGTNLGYQWYKNDIAISNGITRTLTVSQPGKYSVKVSGISTNKCVGIISEVTEVTEISLPTLPAFTFTSKVVSCQNVPYQFSVTTPQANIKYRWDFGDGSIDSGATVSHQYLAYGLDKENFTVKLTAENENKCSSFTTKIISVQQVPEVKLVNAKEFRNCGGGSFNLVVSDASSFVNGDSYKINWGDGSPEVTSKVAPLGLAHDYPVGIYTLKYALTSKEGCTYNVDHNVYNISNPAVSATSLGNTTGCGPLTITFPITNISDNHPSTVYTVDFGDGSPKIVYTSAPPTTISHTYTKASCGSPGNPPAFPADAFIFRITASNGCGSTPAAVGGIRVFLSPVANFIPAKKVVCINTPITFANNTTSACNPNTTYNWNWGDGTSNTFTATKTNPSHTFTQAGTFTVTLVSENSCSPATYSETVTVVNPPVASFTASLTPETGCTTNTVATKNTSTGEEATYAWSIAPNTGYTLAAGSTLTSKDPEFLFSQAGNYVLTLTTTNACKSSTATQNIEIKSAPTVKLPDDKIYCGPQTITFNTQNAQHAPLVTLNKSTIQGYTWAVDNGAIFVNGTNATSQFPTISFPEPKIYTVSLTVTTECGNSIVESQIITINPIPAAPVLTDVAICAGTTATLTPTATGTLKWYASATATTPLFSGVTFVTGKINSNTTLFVEAVSDKGCVSNRIAVNINVNPVVQNNIISGDQIVCSGILPAAIQGTVATIGYGSISYLWETSSDGITFSVASGKNTELSFNPENITKTTWFRRKAISGTCEPHISNVVKIEVSTPIANNSIKGEQLICAGLVPAALVGSAPTGGNNSYVYQWETSSDNINFSVATGKNNEINYAPGILNTNTYFRRKVTSGTCFFAYTNTILVSVNNPVANNIIIASGSTEICVNTAPEKIVGALPTGGDGNYSYQWEISTVSATAGFKAAPGNNTQKDYSALVLTQNTWFRRVATSGSCNVVSDATLIKVTPEITNNFITTKVAALCAGTKAPVLEATSVIGGNGNISFVWQASILGPNNGFNLAASVNNLKDYNPGILNQTTWFRRIAKSGPCSADTSLVLKVQVNAAVANNTIEGNQTICAGSQASIIKGTTPTGGNGQFTYLWESSLTNSTTGFNAATGTNNNESYNPGTLTRSMWFRRKVISTSCEPVISEVVEINVTPAFSNNSVSGSQIICQGSKATGLSGSTITGGNGQFTFVWETSTDSLNFVPAAGNNGGANYLPASITETTYFRRKVTSGSCMLISNIAKITVTELISKNEIDADNEVCLGSSTEIVGSLPVGGNGKYTYFWESSLDNKTYTPATGINNNKNYKPGTLAQSMWFRRKVSGGVCGSNTSAPLQIIVTPVLSNNTIGLAQRICYNTTPAPLTGAVPKGGDGSYLYIWEVSTTSPTNGFQKAPGVANVKDYEPGNLTKTTWFRRIVVSGGCNTISRAVQITVDGTIENNVILGNQTICIKTSPTTFTGATPTGGNETYDYLWESSTDGIKFIPATGTNNQKNYTGPVLTKSTWFRRVVISSPCSDDESNVVFVKVEPIITNNSISTNQTICSGTQPAVLAGTTPQGGSGTYTYIWEMSTTDATTGFAIVSGECNTVNFAPQALTKTTWFRRVVKSGACQQIISDAVKIIVNPLPTIPTVTDIKTCKGTSVTLTATGASDNFAWYSTPNGTTPVGYGKTLQTPVITANTEYYVEAISGNCASPRKLVKVELYNINVSAGEDVTIIQGESVVLRAIGGIDYVWTPAHGLNNANNFSPLAKPEKTTTYLVTIKTAEGCVVTDDITVTVLPRLVTTNGLTPNGDGMNDTWVIKNIENYPTAQIEIFNQWGGKVYSSVGYATPWDGKLNGKELPVAAYYYTIKFSKNEAPISGSITLIR